MLTPNQRRARLIEHGIRQATLARRMGLKPCTVGGVIAGYRFSKRIQQAIAEAIGLPFEEVWGSKPNSKKAFWPKKEV